jgi:uncharacterized delta-60 repeat protein
MKTTLISALAVITLFAVSCGSGARQHSAKPSFSAQTINSAIAEIGAMQAPIGADQAVFTQLKGALKAALIARLGLKLVSTPPTGAENAVPDFAITDTGGGTADLTWHYYNIGDYNQDGVVSVADITPLAMHFGEGWSIGQENTQTAVVDGSGNGTVDISDVTPIAMNFGVLAASYVIESSDAEGGTYVVVQNVPITDGLDSDTERMRFSVNITITPGLWYRVVPVDSNDFIGVPSNAVQAPVSSWMHTWGGSGDEMPLAFSIDNSGNVIAAGSTTSTDTNGNVLVLKYAPTGEILWAKEWGGTAGEAATGIATDNDGNAVVTGWTESYGAGNSDSVVLKYAPDGTLLWQKVWGGMFADYAKAVCVDDDGNAFVAGDSQSETVGPSDVTLYKFQPDGTLEFMKMTGGPDADESWAIDLDSAGNIYIAGTTWNTGAGQFDALLLEFTPTGTLGMKKAWGGALDDRANALYVDADGNVLIAGDTSSFGNPNSAAFTVRFTSSGALDWQTTWDRGSWDEANSVTVGPGNDIYVTGGTWNTTPASTDIFVLRLTESGALSMQNTFAGSGNTWGYSGYVDSSNVFYLLGMAADAAGTWWSSDGIESAPPGIVTDMTFGSADAAISPADFAGTESSPTGTIDSGGGAYDSLVMRIAM